MTKDSPHLNDSRMAWLVALAALLGAGAVAAGFSTPGQRMAKAETRLDDHETRLQKLEDLHDYLKNIGDAVGAQEPPPRKR